MKFNIYESNPVLQGMAAGNQTLDKIVTKMKGAYKDLAVTNFMNAMRDIDTPPDYDGMRARAKAAYETPEGVDAALAAAAKDPKNPNGTVAYLADQIAKGSRRVAMQNYMGQVDALQRNESKRQLIMNNLPLISLMNDGERSAMSMGLGGGNAVLADAAAGAGHGLFGGGGTGTPRLPGEARNEWSLEEVTVNGKSMKVLFNKDTGEYRQTNLGGKPTSTKTDKIESLDWGPYRAVEYDAEVAKKTTLGKGERWEPHPSDPSKWLRLIPDKNKSGGGGGGKPITDAQLQKAGDRHDAMMKAQEQYDIALLNKDQKEITEARIRLDSAKRQYNSVVKSPSFARDGWKPADDSANAYKGGSAPSQQKPILERPVINRGDTVYKEAMREAEARGYKNPQEQESYLKRSGYIIK